MKNPYRTPTCLLALIVLAGILFAAPALGNETAPTTAAPATQSAAPQTGLAADDTAEMPLGHLVGRTALSLVLVLGIIMLVGLGAKHLLNRGFTTTKTRQIEIVDRAFLEQKKTVYLVRVCGRTYLLGSTVGGEMSLLDKFETPCVPAPETKPLA